MSQNLAAVDDVLSRGVDADEAVIFSMLAKASARFRQEAQHDITLTERSEVLRPEGGKVRLHRLPVVSVDSVKAVTATGGPGAAMAAWTFDGIDTIDLRGIHLFVFNAVFPQTINVWVDWTCGFATVPEDVRWCVATMVERAVSSPSPSAVTQESIGSYSYSTGGYSASGAMGMTRDEMAVAHSYRPTRPTMAAVAR